MKELVIRKLDANQRVDKFVRKYLNDAPLSYIYKLFRKKDIKINGHWVKQNYILKENDNLKIYISDRELEEFNKEKIIIPTDTNLDIVYEDNNILIINKPSGILVHGDKDEKRITLSNKVINYLYKKKEYNPSSDLFIPSPCHRLDRNTSGLVIFAKNRESFNVITNLLKEHLGITKTYIALVKGEVDIDGKIEAPLYKDDKLNKVEVKSVKEGAKPSTTLYKRIWTNKKYSLVSINLLTGRTHQIRAHFAYIEHPLIGDRKYGDFKLNNEFKKEFNYDSQFLIALKIKFNEVIPPLDYLKNKEFNANFPKKEYKILSNLGINLIDYNI